MGFALRVVKQAQAVKNLLQFLLQRLPPIVCQLPQLYADVGHRQRTADVSVQLFQYGLLRGIQLFGLLFQFLPRTQQDLPLVGFPAFFVFLRFDDGVELVQKQGRQFACDKSA